jgi:hypothetical protein
MTLRTHLIPQKPRRAIVIGDNDIDIPIIVDIPDGYTPTYFGKLHGRTCHFSDIPKVTTLIMKQVVSLMKRIRGSPQSWQDSNGSIGHKKVEATIIIIIEPSCAKACIRQTCKG